MKSLPVSGKIPDWLGGELFRTTPALFDLESGKVNHWFDGLAMLEKFTLRPQQISFKSRFLRSGAFEEAMEAGRPQRSEFATGPNGTLFQRMTSLFRTLPISDNGNLNIISLGGQLAAASGLSRPLVFDPKDLSTLGPFPYEDAYTGFSLPHPHYDEKGNLYNILTEPNEPCAYTIYKQPVNRKARRKIADIPCETPAFMHSFGMSDRYIILTEFPLMFRSPNSITSAKPVIDNLEWLPERGTVFHVVDRYEAKLVTSARSDAYFSLHHVNAFVEGGTLFIDLAVYPDASILSEFYLNHLRSDAHTVATAQLMRVVIDLSGGEVQNELMLSEATIELPRINPAYHRRSYRFCYGGGNQVPGNFIDSLVKIDLRDGSAHYWRADHCYPGEPVFVRNPNGSREDDGLLLSVVYQSSTNRSFLLILNAENMQEKARAYLPERISFGFHAQFFGFAA